MSVRDDDLIAVGVLEFVEQAVGSHNVRINQW
jgi:hypothetical protein